jgi:hypothetical protein
MSEIHKKHLKGFVLAVYRIGDLLRSALSDYPEVGLRITLFNLSASPGNEYLYSPGHQSSTKPTSSSLKEEMHYSKTIDVTGRRWEIIFNTNPKFFGLVSTNHPRTYLLLGLLITALITILYIASTTRTERVQKIVTERTGELNRALLDAGEARDKLTAALHVSMRARAWDYLFVNPLPNF